MRKQVVYNIADTNIANLGTELEKKVKLEAAQHEEAWKTAGQKEGVEIWRIENFKVVPVPPQTYGQFYNGDSYIVLKTYKKADALAYNVHFWLGEFTTQDEAGTAAYKTVEVDDFLGGKPVQYREVSHHESASFLSYFNPPGMRLHEGGVESGFNHVKPEEYKPRLLHVKGRGNNVAVSEKPLASSSLNSGDVFILDLGLKLITWIGKGAGLGEKSKATTFANAIHNERGGKAKVEVHNEGDSDLAEFWAALGGEGPVKSAAEGGSDEEIHKSFVKRLLSVSDSTGTLKMEQVAEGRVTRNLLKSDDAFILDVGAQIYVWVGSGANTKEKRGALQYAQDYLKQHNRPAHLPIARVLEGGENQEFEAYFDR